MALKDSEVYSVTLEVFNIICHSPNLIDCHDDGVREYWRKNGNGGMALLGFKREVKQGVYMCYLITKQKPGVNKMAIMITLNQIEACDPCESGWDKLLKAQGKSEADNAPFLLADALDSNGLNDTIWALQCQPETVELIPIFAWWCADEVKHLIDSNSAASAAGWASANAAARARAAGAASAANAAARAANAARAASAAELDAEAAGAAAGVARAASAAARTARWASAGAAGWASVWAAAADSEERTKQIAKLRELLS